MSCPSCGFQYPPNSSFCPNCSSTQFDMEPPVLDTPPPAGWEYREIAVRLGTREQPSFAARRQQPWWEIEQHRRSVLEHLVEAQRDGWELDGSPDWQCMVVARRARHGPGQALSRLREEQVEEVVLLRLRRPMQPPARVPHGVRR